MMDDIFQGKDRDPAVRRSRTVIFTPDDEVLIREYLAELEAPTESRDPATPLRHRLEVGRFMGNERWGIPAPRKGELFVERFRGLPVHVLEGRSDLPVVIHAKGLGAPSKYLTWMHAFNATGHTVIYAPFYGTWGAEGEFMSSFRSLDDLAGTVSTLAQFAEEELASSRFVGAAECFGATPMINAAIRDERFEKLVLFGSMIYQSDALAEAVLRGTTRMHPTKGIVRDKTTALGEELVRTQEPRWTAISARPEYRAYPGFDHSVWNQYTYGQTGHSPMRPDAIAGLLDKEVLLIHPEWDGLISIDRSRNLYRSLRTAARLSGMAREEIDARYHLIANQDVDGSHRDSGATSIPDIVGFVQGEEAVPEAMRRIQARLRMNTDEVVDPLTDTTYYIPFGDELRAEYAKYQRLGWMNPLVEPESLVASLSGENIILSRDD